ncbi:DNA replication complex subunit Gins51 [Halorubrum sp. FL23]|uniref:DNA replication complex subunit Gins51 n=1 Tax=Halorubrum sp. FL23 TaxID=3458704 RepID=UPI004034E3C2
MNLDELRSAQSKERRKDSLQHLRDSFYDDVAAYVADLRAARDRRAEQVDKPFSDDDVRRMSDEVETAEEVAEALYERRVGKVVKLASFAAADMPVDADGMTTEERQLFDDLVDRIGENKSRVLDVLAGEAPPASSDAAGADAADPVEAAEALGEGDPTNATDTPSSPGEPPAAEPSPAADPPPPTDPEPPASDPSPPTDPPSREVDEQTGSAGTEGGTDALAGAMGGSDEEVADALDATTDGGSRPADDSTAGGGATAPDGPTEVPPEPAPPGAPDVDADDGTQAAGSDDTSVADDTPTTADNAPAASDATDRATVRITRDVGSIFGVDEREYDLASEDVVTLPAENADPLVQRDAAERLD